MEGKNPYAESIKLQRWILSVGVILLITKFIAFFITNSNAIFTDALESIINVFAAAFSLYSFYLSSRPKDENHPYGHGKIEFISASVEGSLIFLAGALIIAKSIYGLFNPGPPLRELETGIWLIAGAGAINFAFGYYTEIKGKKNKNLVLEAGAKHLLSDAYSTVALIIGLIIVKYTGIYALDNLLAILFGIFIIYTGYKILRRSVAGIMDEADYELLKEIVALLNKNRKPQWIDIHNLRVIKYGSTLHIDCHLTVPWYLNVEEAHREVKSIENLVKSEFGENIELFVHVDPCLTSNCAICSKQDCEHRKFPNQNRMEWKLEHVINDKK